MRAEFLIIGGGLAGVSLALELLDKNRSVLLVDDNNEASSSRVAAGLINPIVPKGVRKTWMCDTIFPNIGSWYNKWEKLLNDKFFTSMNLVQIHPDERTANEWKKRGEMVEMKAYLSWGGESVPSVFNAHFGYSLINGGGRLNTQKFLDAAKIYLHEKSSIQVKKLEYKDLIVGESGIDWDNMRFAKVIFCEGIAAMSNPWFGSLHFHPTAGDVLRVSAKLPKGNENVIWKRKQWLVPDGEGNFLLGSNFHKGSTETKINPSDAELLLNETGKWFNGKLELLEHKRGVRPTVEGRRPYLGQHESGNPVFIFNGLGSKGSSLVTLLSPMMADYLCSGKLLNAEVDIKRFEQADN